MLETARFFNAKKIIKLLFVFLVMINSSILFSQDLTDEENNSQKKEIDFLDDALKIYIDCNSCDLSYIKEQVTFVNYVRDRNVADIHIMYTTQSTGGSGQKYIIEFIGKDSFQISMILYHLLLQIMKQKKLKNNY